MSVEKFDELLERIYKLAVPIDTGNPEKPQDDSTRRSRMLGGLSFMLFESDTRSELEDKLLYGPSITAFTDKPGVYIHVKKRHLEFVPRTESERKTYDDSVAKIGKIETWLNRYEQYVD